MVKTSHRTCHIQYFATFQIGVITLLMTSTCIGLQRSNYSTFVFNFPQSSLKLNHFFDLKLEVEFSVESDLLVHVCSLPLHDFQFASQLRRFFIW